MASVAAFIVLILTIRGCVSQTTEGTRDCGMLDIYDCTNPMDPYQGLTEPGIICSPLRTGIGCLQDLANECSLEGALSDILTNTKESIVMTWDIFCTDFTSSVAPTEVDTTDIPVPPTGEPGNGTGSTNGNGTIEGSAGIETGEVGSRTDVSGGGSGNETDELNTGIGGGGAGGHNLGFGELHDGTTDGTTYAYTSPWPSTESVAPTSETSGTDTTATGSTGTTVTGSTATTATAPTGTASTAGTTVTGVTPEFSSTPELPFFGCDWEGMNHCTNIITYLEFVTDLETRCFIAGTGSLCFNVVLSNCTADEDDVLIQVVEDHITSLRDSFMEECDEYMESVNFDDVEAMLTGGSGGGTPGDSSFRGLRSGLGITQTPSKDGVNLSPPPPADVPSNNNTEPPMQSERMLPPVQSERMLSPMYDDDDTPVSDDNFNPEPIHDLPAPDNPRAPVCDWSSAQACDDLMDTQAQHGPSVKLCTPLQNGLNCLTNILPVCINDVIKVSVEQEIERIKSDMREHCSAEFCDMVAVRECTDPMVVLHERTDPGICEPLATGMTCLKQLLGICKSGTEAVTVHDALNKANVAMSSFCDNKDPPSPNDCSWSAIKGCTDPLERINGIEIPSIVCTPWKVCKECLEYLVPSCYAGDTKDVVLTTINTLNTGHDLLCTAQGDSNTCTRDTLRKCTSPMEEMAGESELSKICNTWQDIEECLVDADSHCRDEGVKRTIQSTLRSIRSSLVSCAPVPEGDCDLQALQECHSPMKEFEGQTNLHTMMDKMCPAMASVKRCIQNHGSQCRGSYSSLVTKTLEGIETNMNMFNCQDRDTAPIVALVCNWDAVKRCTRPLENLQGMNDPAIVCKPWAEGKDCLKRLEPICTAEHKWVITDTIEKLDNSLTQRCSNYDFGESKACAWENLQQCTALMETIAGESDINKICGTWREADKCLTDIEPGCSDGTVKSTIHTTLQSIRSNLQGSCPSEEGCNFQTIQECNAPMKEFEGLTERHLASDRMCPAIESVKKCMQSLQPSCTGSARYIMSNTLRAIDMEMNKFDCPEENNDGSAGVSVRSSMVTVFVVTLTFLAMCTH